MTHNQYFLFDGEGDEKVPNSEKRQILERGKIVELDPCRVSIWSGNGRSYKNLTEAGCRDLIDSVIAARGQQIPVFVRRVSSDENHDFELIVGTRRHWAISWLQANGQPSIKLRAVICSLSDEQAFLLADVENRARADISALERARSYKDALGKYYDGRQAKMAERLRISPSWLSKQITIASLPNAALAQFEL